MVSNAHVACGQALLFGRAKRAVRERASEGRSREGPAKGERSFNWRLSPISTPELAQSVFPLPSPSSQLVEVFSLASRGRGWGRESLPHFQQCSRERSRKIHAPGISWGPLGHLSNCQFQKWGIFKSGIIMVVVTFSITVKHLKRIKTKFVHPLERKENHENVSLL